MAAWPGTGRRPPHIPLDVRQLVALAVLSVGAVLAAVFVVLALRAANGV